MAAADPQDFGLELDDLPEMENHEDVPDGPGPRKGPGEMWTVALCAGGTAYDTCASTNTSELQLLLAPRPFTLNSMVLTRGRSESSAEALLHIEVGLRAHDLGSRGAGQGVVVAEQDSHVRLAEMDTEEEVGDGCRNRCRTPVPSSSSGPKPPPRSGDLNINQRTQTVVIQPHLQQTIIQNTARRGAEDTPRFFDAENRAQL
ncbi:unnamed protein product [Symbiodinium sp. CCMP2592]|nr:unnamed protein product [Symbiodinium sp. CCMP2592]